MTGPIYLTDEELREITGRVKYSAQLRALRAMGFTVRVRPDGSPLVSRAHWEQVMGGLGPARRRAEGPRLEALSGA